MRFVLKITELGNDAFGDCPQACLAEVSRILTQAAESVADGNSSGNLRDGNGNTVGFYEVTQ